MAANNFETATHPPPPPSPRAGLSAAAEPTAAPSQNNLRPPRFGGIRRVLSGSFSFKSKPKPKPSKGAVTGQGWQAYENQNQLRAYLLQGGPLSPHQQDLFLQALDAADSPIVFQDVICEFEEALINLNLPMSLDSRAVDLNQAMKDMLREVIVINGQVHNFDSKGAQATSQDEEEAPVTPADAGMKNGASQSRLPKLSEFLEHVPASLVRREPVRFDDAKNNADSPPPESEMDRRTAAVWEVLEREIRAFGQGAGEQEAQSITDVQVQAFTQRACAAMARTGFGGDAYHAVMALMGSSNKVIRPVVKPNQESVAAKIAAADQNGFDPQAPLPIHIDVLPQNRVVQVTTTSVFDIHLMEHLSAPERYLINGDRVLPLARICAVVHEEIDFATEEPRHSRRLNISLMETLGENTTAPR